MAHYTIAYTVRARIVLQAAMVVKLGALALDPTLVTVGGLTVFSDDHGLPVGTTDAKRTIVYASTPGQLIPNPQMAAVLSGYYTQQFSRALSTPVVADPVVVT